MAQTFDLVVLGAGPAGYVAAIRGAQIGMRVACIDRWVGKEDKPSLGGTCLNVGCIPSKALLESSEHFHRCKQDLKDHGITTGDVRMDVPAMIARKDKIVRGLASGVTTLFAKNKVVSFAGTGRLLSGMRVEVSATTGGQTEILEAKNIIVATGSLPRDIDAVPTDGKVVVDLAGALDFQSVPEKLGVIGAGVIGLELGSVWHRLGSQVVLLEAMDTFLPGADEQIADTAFKEMSRQGLDIRLGARVLSAKTGKTQVQVTYEDCDGKHTIDFSKLVVAVGRKPNTEGLKRQRGGAAARRARLHPRRRILPHESAQHLRRGRRRARPHARAQGIGRRHHGSRAHRRRKDARELRRHPVDHLHVAEIAWVGKTERQLRAAARDYKIGAFPLSANGRARAMGQITADKSWPTNAATGSWACTSWRPWRPR